MSVFEVSAMSQRASKTGAVTAGGRPRHARSEKPGKPGSSRKKPRAAGWVPNQHGAWAMLIAPYVIGLVATIAAGRFRPADVALFGLWIVGYFAFYATSLWLKSKRKPRYLPPVRTYVLISAALGALTLALDISIWSWLIPFAPILLIGLYFAHQRDDRSLASGVMTVAAACLMPAVLYADGVFDFVDGMGAPGYDLIAVICVACFGYFFGTVLYVKTMIRERGHVGYVVASALWHVLCVVGALLLAVISGAPAEPWVGWTLGAFFVVMTARSLVMPLLWPMRGKVLRPGLLGIGELFATLALVAILIGAVIGAPVA